MQKLEQQYQRMLVHRAQLNFQTADIIKAALKLEASVTNAATYHFFSSIKGNAKVLLLRLSLNLPPATLQLRKKILIQSHRSAKRQGHSPEQLVRVTLQAAAMQLFLKGTFPIKPSSGTFLLCSCEWQVPKDYTAKLLSQPANTGPQDVPRTSPSNVPRTSPKDPI